MKIGPETLLLYALTDGGQSPEGRVRPAIEGGVTCVQVRDKSLGESDLAALAARTLAVCREYGVPCIVNDSLSAALASDADGLHIGQEDGEPEKARALLGPEKILGVSVTTAQEAERAIAAGADYLGVGAVFPTATKPDAHSVSLASLAELCALSSIPVVAIGGITVDNAHRLAGSGLAGIAVISALFPHSATTDDIRERARRLRDAAIRATGGTDEIRP